MINSQVISLSNPLWSKTLQVLRHDIYHLPEYMHIEAIRNNAEPEAILIVDNDNIFFVPYLLRRCSKLFEENLLTPEIFDVVSPYGYPGILLNDSAYSKFDFLNLALAQLLNILQAKGVCSAFFRLHPILNQGFNEILSSDICKINGGTVSIDLMLSEAEIWQHTRAEHRNHINRAKRAGFKAKIVKFEDHISEFICLYKETMNRVNAKEVYYFDEDYFNKLATLNEKIHLGIVELDGQVTCAVVLTEAGGIVQYHLGGTKNEFLKQSPSKLMFDYVRFWAKERGNKVFHLGGGVGGSKDSLYHFKAGFSRERNNFLTLRLIADEEKYRYLVNLQAKALNTEADELVKNDFFPAYRCIL